ncbi:MAG TPA: non-homologous end-joining DNA ligase [Bacillota bacterium]|nr:non-homologous end-joining DNA ligase [Bacillota bacterium]
METTLTINSHHVPVKNLDKVFWPEDGFTKGDIMRYYADIWPVLAPHLTNRPVSLVRYPEGITGNFFYQKDVPKPPKWLTTCPIPSDDRIIRYAVLNNLESLIWSINLGCIEVHPWLSRLENLTCPTYIIIDLDPMEPAVFSDAATIALRFRLLLKELRLQSFPKTSGATGIHIYIPIAPRYTFRQTSTFVKKLGDIIIQNDPKLATNERKITDRGGKVYIDHLQNLEGKTIASVYSIRPFPKAPVSMPVSWEELPDCHPSMFTIVTAPERIRRTGDLFKPLLTLEQTLPEEFLS